MGNRLYHRPVARSIGILTAGGDSLGLNAAIRAVGKAMEVFGGYGFIREYPIQRFYRDLKGIEFGAGTNQIQRMIILKNLLNGAEPFPL